MRLTGTQLLILTLLAAFASPARADNTQILGANPASVTFTYGNDGKLPAPIPVQITCNKGTAPITVAVDAATPAPWLVITPSASAPGPVSLRVNPSNLSARTYPATVNVTSPATTTGTSFKVNLVVKGTPPTLTTTPERADFTFSPGDAATTPAKISASIASSGQAVSVTLKSTAPTWLKVSKDAGVAVAGAPLNFDISVDSTAVASMAPKAYTGNITVTSSDSSVKPFNIPVALTITQGLPTISTVYPNKFAVNASNAVITLTGTNYFSSSVVTIGPKDVPSTSVTYVSSNVLLVAVPASVLTAPGLYSVKVRNSATAVSVPNTLQVLAATPAIAAVTNVASYNPKVAPGTIVSIFGSGFGPADLEPAIVSGGKYPTTVADVKVQFERGVAGVWVDAPLIFIRADQINAVVPFSAAAVAPSTDINVRVVTDASSGTPVYSAAFPVPFGAADPGIFTVDGSGVGQAIVLNQSSTGAWLLNSKDNPALKNTTIVIYLTGAGGLSGGVTDGTVITTVPPALPPLTLQNATITVDGKPCAPEYSGAVEGSVAGLVQVNCKLDSAQTTNATAPLVVTYGGVASPTGVTVNVKE